MALLEQSRLLKEASEAQQLAPCPSLVSLHVDGAHSVGRKRGKKGERRGSLRRRGREVGSRPGKRCLCLCLCLRLCHGVRSCRVACVRVFRA
eukprot:1387455-Rhodomonas_salina.1